MNKKAVTLVELVIVSILISVFVISISVVQLFVHNQFLSNERKIQVQNDAQFVIEHIVGQAYLAVGDVIAAPVDITFVNELIIYQKNEMVYNIRNNLDFPIKYIYKAPNISYLANPTIVPEILSRKITQFDVDYKSGDNFFTVNITACWRPSGVCGSIENPSINFKTRVIMPQVSAN